MTIYWGDGTSTATHPSGGATQSSGTWSPTYYNFGSSGSISTAAAQYIAVGDLVHFNIRFSIGWYTYDSDTIGFTLPYTNGGNRNVVVGWIDYNDRYLIGRIDSGSSYCLCSQHNNPSSYLTYRPYWNNTLQLSGTYQK